jgi:hypothetical protein
MLTVVALSGVMWCWNQNVVPAPMAKLDRLPPSCQTTSPLGRCTL